MARRRALLALTILFTAGLSSLGAARRVGAAGGRQVLQAADPYSGGYALVTGELIVKFKPTANATHKSRALGKGKGRRKRLVRARRGTRGELVLAAIAANATTPTADELKAAAQRISSDPAVDYVEPNYILNVTQANTNDPYLSSLWGLLNEAAGADAWGAWAAGYQNCSGVVIGVVDSGCQIDHPDLEASIWTNPGEIPGDSVDNDGNGFVDDVHGWDFHGNDATVFDDAQEDFHGTHIAGIIGATGNNSFGVVGVCQRGVKLIPVKYLSGLTGGTLVNAIAALWYLLDLKQRYNLNMVATQNSWGSGSYSQALYEVIEAHNAAGILFVAAAGNNGLNNDINDYYPANFNLSNVISVGSIARSGAVSSFSNYGKTTVDLFAPGSLITSTYPPGSFGTLDGTSMAAPHVTGAIALYAANHLHVLGTLPTPDSIKSRVMASGVASTAYANKSVSGRRLNINSMLAPLTPSTSPEPGTSGFSPSPEPNPPAASPTPGSSGSSPSPGVSSPSPGVSSPGPGVSSPGPGVSNPSPAPLPPSPSPLPAPPPPPLPVYTPGCREIPTCKPSRCGLKAGDGQVKICRSCRDGYIPSGELENCVCPPGFYEQCDALGNNCACWECSEGFYCPGGDLSARNGALSAEKGVRYSCHKAEVNAGDTTVSVQALGLTTLGKRAKSHVECMPMPGYRLEVATQKEQTAALCTGATYSPGYKRLRSCIPCQSGLVAEPSLSPASLRTSKSQVCRIPPGYFLAQNLVRRCPAGRYREGIASVEEEAGRLCKKCGPGLTTERAGATSPVECRMAMAGYSLAPDGTIQQCSYGFYSSGGTVNWSSKTSTCTRCPNGVSTKELGSTDVTDCMVPPGYYIKGDALAKCPTNITRNGISQGYYRFGWAPFSDPSVYEPATGDGSRACSACGAGVLSELTDIDVRNEGDNPAPGNGSTITNSRVAASAQSCYILPGQGIVIDPDTGKPFAEDCPESTYGAPGNRTAGDKIYGTMLTPCKPCNRFMWSPAKSTSFSDCVNSGGYGVTTLGQTATVVQCAEGWFAEPASMLPCNECPYGRTTKFTGQPGGEQSSIHQCYVKRGFGIFFSNTSSWQPGDLELPTNRIPDDTSLKVMECPEGYYGPGGIAVNSVNSLCIQCDSGSLAPAGSTDASDCNDACEPGYGHDASGDCVPCPLGTYSEGTAASNICSKCRSTLFVYMSSRDVEESIASQGTTLVPGARASSSCVSSANQLYIDAGDSFYLDDLGTWVTRARNDFTMSQCIWLCDPGMCCFAQLQYSGVKPSGVCSTMMLPTAPANTSNTTSGWLLYYKLIPSDAIAAFSRPDSASNASLVTSVATEAGVAAKMMSSTAYWACTLPGNIEVLLADPMKKLGANVEGAGVDGELGGMSRKQCQEECDKRAACWGLFYNFNASKCLLRSGAAAPNVRSFFVIPGQEGL